MADLKSAAGRPDAPTLRPSVWAHSVADLRARGSPDPRAWGGRQGRDRRDQQRERRRSCRSPGSPWTCRWRTWTGRSTIWCRRTLDEAAVAGCRVRVRFAGRLVDGFVLDRGPGSEHEGRLAFLEQGDLGRARAAAGGRRAGPRGGRPVRGDARRRAAAGRAAPPRPRRDQRDVAATHRAALPTPRRPRTLTAAGRGRTTRPGRRS